MTALDDLRKIVLSSTLCYRKGAEVTVTEHEGFRKVEINGYPETPSRGLLVDVHFLNIGFTEAAADPEPFKQALLRALGEAKGEFTEMDLATAKGGPSYIAWGAWIGSQDLALRLLALGEHHGLWEVVTPRTLDPDMPQDRADQLAGMGMVMNAGFRPEVLV